jgi:hypothetical protein
MGFDNSVQIRDPMHFNETNRTSSQANWETPLNKFPNNPDTIDHKSIPTTIHSFAQVIDSPLHQINTDSETDILYQPESLLKLLTDDSDLMPHSSVVSTDIQSDYPQPSADISSQPKPTTATAILRIPEYIKAAARLFPLVIGSETYALPYNDSGSTVVVLFQVVHAAGEFVVAKVTGCGPFDANKPYPDGIMLTLADEIKVIHTKSLSEMTIEEQIQYHSLKVRYPAYSILS